MGSKAPQPIPPPWEATQLHDHRGYPWAILRGLSDSVLRALYYQEFRRPSPSRRPSPPPPPPKMLACPRGRCCR